MALSQGLDKATGEWLLRELGESPSEPEKAVEWAIEKGGLVLLANPPSAYWKGDLIDIEWNEYKACWDFLDSLATQAKRGGVLDAVTGYLGRRVKPEAIKHRKSRLVNLTNFPSSLADEIESPARCTYQLNVPPDQIHLFESVVSESLRG